jgi:hypothetical protein
MKKIEGRVRNLQIEDSKIHPLKNIEKQTSSAMLGTLASSNALMTKDGVHVSVMEYRKNLKGPDPYPEDYFCKNTISE